MSSGMVANLTILTAIQKICPSNEEPMDFKIVENVET